MPVTTKDYDANASPATPSQPNSVSLSSYTAQPSSPATSTTPTKTSGAVSPPKTLSANRGVGWKVATVIFLIATVVAVIGWIKTYDSLRKWTSAHDQTRSGYVSESQQREALKREKDRIQSQYNDLWWTKNRLENENQRLRDRVGQLTDVLREEEITVPDWPE